MILYSEQLLYPDRKINYLADGSSAEQHIWHIASAVSLTSRSSFRPSIRHIRRVLVSIVVHIEYHPVRDTHTNTKYELSSQLSHIASKWVTNAPEHSRRFTLQSVIDIVQLLQMIQRGYKQTNVLLSDTRLTESETTEIFFSRRSNLTKINSKSFEGH